VNALERTALSPTMSTKVVSSNDRFLFGTYKDNGTTLMDSEGVTTANQILVNVPVNPTNLIGVAKCAAIYAEEDPPEFNATPFIRSSYRFCIPKCTVKATGLVPDSVSSKVGVFYTSKLSRKITPKNVLSIFSSLPKEQKMVISARKDSSFSFSTGWCFLENDPTTEHMMSDPKLSHAGYICAFVIAPCVSGLAAASSEGVPNRSYGGPLLKLDMNLQVEYQGYEKSPISLGTEEDTTPYHVLHAKSRMIPTGAAIKGMLAWLGNGNSFTTSCYVLGPKGSTPDVVESAVINTEEHQQQHGAYLGTTGNLRDPSFNVRPDPEAPGIHVRPISLYPLRSASGVITGDNNLGIIDWVKDFVASAISGFSSLDQKIQSGFVNFFGPEFGDIAYSAAKKLFGIALEAAAVLILVDSPQNTASNGSGLIWNAEGVPCWFNGSTQDQTPIAGPLKPLSDAYNQSLALLSALPAPIGQQYVDAQNAAIANNTNITIMCIPTTQMFQPVATPYPQPAYADSMGEVGFWTRMEEGKLVVKDTFGQPSDATPSEIVPQINSIVTSVGPALYLKGDAAPISLHIGQGTGSSYDICPFDLSTLAFDADNNPILTSSSAILRDANVYLQRFQPADVRYGVYSDDSNKQVIEHVLEGHVVPYLNAVGDSAILGEAIPATLRLVWSSDVEDSSVHRFNIIHSKIDFHTASQLDAAGHVTYKTTANFLNLSDLAFISDTTLLVDLPLFNFHGIYVRSRYVMPELPDDSPDVYYKRKLPRIKDFHRA
jgi:hypothetical protein